MGLPLTDPNPEVSRLHRSTVPGMAHWAGTGPVGARCGGCVFFTLINRSTRCAKYAQMMNGKWGSKKLPDDMAACKYFGAKPELSVIST